MKIKPLPILFLAAVVAVALWQFSPIKTWPMSLGTFWPEAPKEAVAAPLGRDNPVPGALMSNGFIVGKADEPKFRAFYERYQAWLGEAITTFDGREQTFRFGRLTYNPSNKAGWEIELANVGMFDLQQAGLQPVPGSLPHPLVRDWLIAQQEAGVDVVRLIGRIISDPICVRRVCSQWTDKQRLTWAQNETAIDRVYRAPLGQWLTHPQERPKDQLPNEDSGVQLTPLTVVFVVLAILLALLLVVLLLLRRSGGGYSSGTRRNTAL
jgi:hypothetical protein